MKQIDVRYYKICQWVINDKVIDLVKISIKKNLAEMMTKIISVEKFKAYLNFIKASKGKVENELLGESHVKSKRGKKER